MDHTATTFRMSNLNENIPCAFVECAATLEPILQPIGKPPTQNPKSFLTNMLLMSMIRAPTLEIQPLPEHFKYHHPFNDQLHAVGSIKA